MQIVATNGAKDSTLEICKADRAKPQSALAMTFSWAAAHDCFCDHFQVLYPSMLGTCCSGASHRDRC